MLDVEASGNIRGAKPSVNHDRFADLLELFYGNWIWRAVLTLIDHPKFNSSPKWISETLNISIEEAVDAFEGLEELHLVSRSEDGRLIAKSPTFIVPEDKTSKNFIVKKHKLVSQQILARSTPVQMEGTLTYFMNVSKEELYSALEKVFSELKTLGASEEKGQNPGVYAISLTCSNIAPQLQEEK